MRPPISLERMEWDGQGGVRYRGKRGHDGGGGQVTDSAGTIDLAEFLARVLMHIPEPRRHLVRYYGWYSNVSRGRRKQFQKGLANSEAGTDTDWGNVKLFTKRGDPACRLSG